MHGAQPLLGMVWLSAALPVGLAIAPSGPVFAATSRTPDSPTVRQLSRRTIAEVGRTRVVAFRVQTPADVDRSPESTVSDPNVLEVVVAPMVAAGERLGYSRVRGLRRGTADLTIAGDKLTVKVVGARGRDNITRFEPRIIGPSSGAAVWGKIAIGVELRERSAGILRRITVRLSNGAVLKPTQDSEWRQRPHRQLLFALDTESLPPAMLELTAVATDRDGNEQTGDPVRVHIMHPEAGDIAAGEAEARYEVDRPQRFADERMTVGRHKAASGGMFFANASANPAVCFPISVAEPGWYQVMLVAGGTRAQGALPTVGIVIDGANNSTTNGRLLSEDWQRMAVGVPFKLTAGDHVITPYFANDFYVPNVVDRNLYLDRIEIARTANAELGSSNDAGGMMMAGAARAMAMMEAEPEGAGVVTDDPLGISTVPLRVAFIRPLDGATLPGLIELEGRCWWENAKQAPPPIVTLMINGNLAMRQRSGAPRFWVDPSNFKSGANTIQFVARLDSGSAVDTPVQTMFWPAAAASDRLPARNHVRFSIHDERWEPGIKEMLRSGHNPKERRAAAFASNSEVALNVPDDMIGSFHVFLEVLGEHFDGAPIAAVYLRHGDEKTAVGEVEAPGWWDMTRRVGLVELAAGPKQLIVAFENDKYEEGKGDRNLWLQAVILAQKSESDDRAAPVVDVAYPADNQDMYMADALVGQASDNASLRSVELIIDGVETGQVVTLNTRPGDFVLPLLLRSVEPGPHTVAARVTDLAGNSTLSEPRKINVLPGPPQRMGQYERAIHLLNRFAYGPDQRELAALLTMGESAWLADRLDRSFEDPGDLAALAAGFGYFVNRNQYEVPRRVISHLLLTPNPVRARFVLWTENHFSTWIRKINGVRKWDEHIAFSRLGPAPFHALLLASAESPAMLGYLDQDTSFAGRLNENYAREIMELHTLGVDGGYSQGDVTRLAGLLTGWTAALEGDGRGGGPFAAQYTYRFDPKLNDGSATSILGMRFPRAAPQERFDRIHLALELLVAHPSTARFVSRSLAEHYVGVPAPDALVDDLAAVFTETAGDMRALLIAISEHPAFWDAAASQRVAAPLDYAIRLSRTTGHYQPWQLGDFLQRSGQGLFDCPTPDGYPEDDAFQTDSNALLQRWRLAREWMWPLMRVVPNGWRSGNAPAQREWTQRVVDVIAVRLTGRVLSENSNQAALDLLSAGSGNRDQRVRTLAPFIAQLPEANLR